MRPHKEMMVIGILYGVMEWLFLGLAYFGSLATVPHPDGVALFSYLGIAGVVVTAWAAFDAFKKAEILTPSAGFKPFEETDP